MGNGAATYLAVSYHVDDSYYSNVGRGTSRRAQRVYWRNIAVMFASARRFFPEPTVLVAFSNVGPPPSEAQLLAELGVRIMDIGYHQPYPLDFYPRFRGAFHLFDVIEWFARNLRTADRAIIVDPDCVWVRNPGSVVETLDRDGALSCSVSFPPDRASNGVSRNDMAKLFGELTGMNISSPPTYRGGEFVGLTGATASQVAATAGEVTVANIGRWRRGKTTLNTEEHILTYVFWRLGIPPNHESLMRRIHTSPLWRNVSPDPFSDEFALTLWHLLSEKKRGLYDLFSDARHPSSPFWMLTDDAFREYMARRTGIIRGPVRRLEDSMRPPLIHAKHAIGLRRHRDVLVRPGE